VWGETGEAYQNAGLLRKDVLREVGWTELAVLFHWNVHDLAVK